MNSSCLHHVTYVQIYLSAVGIVASVSTKIPGFVPKCHTVDVHPSAKVAVGGVVIIIHPFSFITFYGQWLCTMSASELVTVVCCSAWRRRGVLKYDLSSA